jgi:hypothetical protein
VCAEEFMYDLEDRLMYLYPGDVIEVAAQFTKSYPDHVGKDVSALQTTPEWRQFAKKHGRRCAVQIAWFSNAFAGLLASHTSSYPTASFHLFSVGRRRSRRCW